MQAERRVTDGSAERPERSTLELVRAIATDTGTLVRKEVELARHEITESLTARAKAAGAAAAAGVLALMGIVFGGLAVAAALDAVVAEWLSRLIVAAGFFVLAGGAVGFAVVRAKRPSLVPEETKRTVKEDVEWAKAQLRR